MIISENLRYLRNLREIFSSFNTECSFVVKILTFEANNPFKMNILILGSGGREHALAWKLAQSKKINKIFIGPGNAGTSSLGTNLRLDPMNFIEVKNAVIENKINMVIVG